MNRIHIRSVKKHETYFRDVDGSIRAFLPTDTLWYKLYCKGEPQNNRLKMMFCKRFRMPHNSFVSICNDISKVDIGVLEWSCTIPPMKNAINYKFIRFSEWLESMQKDAECTFGILKGRFTILKTGVRMQSLKKVDQLFRTCCAIHNCLLFVDGLDKGWEDGVQSYWEQQEKNIKSFPLQRLNRIYNQNSSSSIINDKMLDCDKEHLNKSEKNGVRYVKKIPFDTFYKCLVNHFDICFKKRDIKWPRRVRSTPKVI